jgi:outer membrane protein OmpA-like peptidoglycan-associated protein
VLHFPQSHSFLLPAAEQELEILAAFMTRNNTCKIELAGHTDDLGDDYKNMLLSYDRVDEVKKFLVSRRIAADRIRGRGFGSTSPIAPNDSEANRKLNRRVEVRISSAK